MESLSTTLGWHPHHLSDVLRGSEPSGPDDPVADRTETLWSRLDVIEQRLNEITERLDDLRGDLSTVVEHVRER